MSYGYRQWYCLLQFRSTQLTASIAYDYRCVVIGTKMMPMVLAEVLGFDRPDVVPRSLAVIEAYYTISLT